MEDMVAYRLDAVAPISNIILDLRTATLTDVPQRVEDACRLLVARADASGVRLVGVLTRWSVFQLMSINVKTDPATDEPFRYLGADVYYRQMMGLDICSATPSACSLADVSPVLEDDGDDAYDDPVVTEASFTTSGTRRRSKTGRPAQTCSW